MMGMNADFFDILAAWKCLFLEYYFPYKPDARSYIGEETYVV
jgi:hypothetical protein